MRRTWGRTQVVIDKPLRRGLRAGFVREGYRPEDPKTGIWIVVLNRSLAIMRVPKNER